LRERERDRGRGRGRGREREREREREGERERERERPMLGDSGSSVLGSSGDAVAAMAASVLAQEGAEVGGVGSNSGEEDKGYNRADEGERSYGGNRWPRQETLALLKIRSDMGVVFRDASVKGPLWEEVSR
jgi:hypothetical protein